MRRTLSALSLALLVLGAAALPAAAQTYRFRVPEEEVDVFLESDGSMRIVYRIVFENDPSASPLDYVDIGLPTESYDQGAIRAWIDGQAVNAVEDSPYVEPGVAIALGSQAISPGSRGELVVEIPRVGNVLYSGDEAGYASAKFSPTWFGSEFVSGLTDLTVTFHLPPGVGPDEPRWHIPEGGWPTGDPAVGLDEAGRIVYSWRNTQANAYTSYVFGASFPSVVVPEESLQSPLAGWLAGIFGFVGTLASCSFPVVPFLIVFGLIVFAQRRRRLAYLPPKISVEGHGIKRGLTAVEAAVLLQIGLDKVLTMILFGLIRKGAARVVTEDPLELEPLTVAEEELRAYETAFLKAAVDKNRPARQRALSDMMIELVRSVEKKMKGFSLKETREYYASIMRKAWAEIEAAGTPEVKSEKFAEGLEWLMLDGDFTGHTRRTFEAQPVFLPRWWGHYAPSSGTSVPRAGAPVRSASIPAGRSVSLPHLPGSDFAASIARGIQNSAGALVGNVSSFTQSVAKTTNPPPVTRSYGGRSGGGCACACACAGCACACAGGGR